MRVPGLIDAHCHLDYPPMADDLGAALQRGAAAGIEAFVHVACSRRTWARGLDIARHHAHVSAAVGIHPHEASTCDDAALAEVETMAAEPDVVAIGETGLDYYYNRSKPAQQQRSLARHVELATRLGLPLVLHVRDAHDEALAIAREAGIGPAMVHCFSGTPDEARRWLDAGLHLSFSGIATFKDAEPIREAARLCPDDRILLETDAPYLAPVPKRGRKNEPANLAFTCQRLAGERGVSPEELAAVTSANARRLLSI